MNLLIKSSTFIAFLATSVVNAGRSEVTYYFDSELAADPAAVPGLPVLKQSLSKTMVPLRWT